MFDSEGSNLSTVREGHGYRALACLQNTTWAYYTPVRWKMWGGASTANARYEERRVGKVCRCITRCWIYGGLVGKGNLPVSGRRP